MKANELRIGNWVKRLDNTEFQVSGEDIHIISNWSGSKDLLPNPIPLTEEWLLKFGFKLNMDWFNWNAAIGENEIGDFKLALRHTDDFGWFYKSRCTPIKYVHQLQNLYFALTGEELTYGGNK